MTGAAMMGPTIEAFPRNDGLFDYVCNRCGASWVGPIINHHAYWVDSVRQRCEWCYRRYRIDRKARAHRLQFPEWLNWGDRYFNLSELEQRVWEETRGFYGDFHAKWERDVFAAVDSSLLSPEEAVSAIARIDRWVNTRDGT